MSETLNDAFNRRRRFSRALIGASLVFAVLTVAEDIDQWTKKAPGPSSAERIGQVLGKYDATFAHNVAAENDAIDLEALSPLDFQGLSTDGKLKQGLRVQSDAEYISMTLLASGSYPARQADAYDVAGALIPSQTQTAMTNAGIEMTPVAPVDCDINGTYFNPYDYSNSTPSAFEVRISATPPSTAAVITVPLGAAQQAGSQDPFLRGSLPQTVNLDVIPCTAQPERTHPPKALRPFLLY